MILRLLKKKIINFTQNKKKHKFSAEKLFKFNLKTLNKLSKKPYKFIIFLTINYSLPAFGLVEKKFRIKRLKIIKYKPFFILKNKTKIFFSIKKITDFYKYKKKVNNLMFSNEINSFLINNKIENQTKAIIYKSILKFYRWY